MYKILIIILILITPLFLTAKTYAQFEADDFFPCEQTISGSCDEDPVNSTIENFFRFGVSLIFAGFIGFGIFIIIKASLKIINSEGGEEELESGASAIKSVFVGVIMLILGAIGLLVLGYVLDASGIFGTEVENPAGVDNLPIIN